MIAAHRTVLCLLACAAPILVGCSGMLVSSEPPERAYWLESHPISGHIAASVDVSLVPALDSHNIWILQSDGRLNYFAGAVWPDRLGRLLPDVINRSVPRPEQTEPVQLDVVIERFFAIEGVADEPPLIELQALVAGPEGPGCRLVATDRPPTARLRDIAASHQRVLNRLIDRLPGLAAEAAAGAPLSCE